MLADLGDIAGSIHLKETYGSAEILPHKRVVAFHMDLPDTFLPEQFQHTLSVVTHLACESFSILIWVSPKQLAFVWELCEKFFNSGKLKIQQVIWVYAMEPTGLSLLFTVI